MLSLPYCVCLCWLFQISAHGPLQGKIESFSAIHFPIPSLPLSLPACLLPKWAGFLFRLGFGGGRGEGRDETCKGDQMIEYVGGGRGMVGVG